MSVAAPAPEVRKARSARAPSGLRSLAVVIRSELRIQRRAPLTWGGSLGAMSALMAAIWPSIEDSIGQAIESYPSALKEAFNIRGLETVEQYVDVEMLSLMIPLALGYFAVRSATRAVSGGEERGHLDALLSLPLSRRVLVAGSYIVAGVMLVAILAVIWALTWLVGTAAGTEISASTLASGLVNVWPLSMAFAGLAVLAAGVLHRWAPVTGIATGVLVAMYVIDLVGKISPEIEPLRALSAFRYYGSAIQDGLDLSHMALLTLAGVALAAAGALLFERRDVL